MFVSTTCFATHLISNKSFKRLGEAPIFKSWEKHDKKIPDGGILEKEIVAKGGKKWDLDNYRKYIRPVSISVDVRAGNGVDTVLMASMSERGYVISFELDPEKYEELCEFAVRCKNIVCVNAGIENVWDLEDGRYDDEDFFDLDYFKFKHVSFVRIDSPKKEYGILSGASETIERCKPVIYMKIDKNLDVPVDTEELTSYQRKCIEYILDFGYIVKNERDNFIFIPK